MSNISGVFLFNGVKAKFLTVSIFFHGMPLKWDYRSMGDLSKSVKNRSVKV